MSLRAKGVAISIAVGLFVTVTATPASATTFCVPAFSAACQPGPNVQEEANLQTAMATLSYDGIPDKVIIGEGTLSPAGSITPVPFDFADDPLEVVGAGVDKTKITSSTGGNILVVNLAGPNFFRKVTMKDLTIVVPPPSGASATAIQTRDDVFERVNFESKDPTPGGSGAKGVYNLGGGVFRDVKFFGTGGGLFIEAFSTGFAFPGDTLEISGADVSALVGIGSLIDSVLPITIKRSHFRVDSQVLSAMDGDQTTVENSIIEAGQYIPFNISSTNASETKLTLRNNTILNLGGAPTAIDSSVYPGASGSASTVVSDSIISGFPDTWKLNAPSSPADGNSNLDVSYSNISSTGTLVGDGTVNATLGVINETPLFVGLNDFHLSPGSPSIDAGDPAPGGILDDIEGNIRPLDGNGDGIAVRDQGAYEAPALFIHPPDGIPPRVTKLKAKKIKKKAKVVQFSFKSSEKATVKFTFKPTGKKQPKRKTVKLTKNAKAGMNAFKVKKSRLKPGKYLITVKATDVAGNSRTVKLKAIYLKSGKKFNVQKN